MPGFNPKTTIIPGMRYRDAPAAIDWLCDVLGFEPRLVVPNEDGTIAHAQLVLGDGMIMLGSSQGTQFDGIVGPPSPEGTLTQSAYIVVEDVKSLYERVKAAGANIVMELEEQHYGGSLFAVRDPEGQLWNVGSYNPWAEPQPGG
ncbi:MAG: VOC family protein [Chloroflexota bacterium]|nr:VOC family protein [Chloroflexota bacterium]MDE2970338.1 VOC family protein [Chloroflexota bacterium]